MALYSSGERIAGPIRRIWAGERDPAALTAGIDPNRALIREIETPAGGLFPDRLGTGTTT